MKKSIALIKILALLLSLTLVLTSCTIPGIDSLLGLIPNADGNTAQDGYEITDELPTFEHRHDGVPYFTEDEITDTAFESYSDIDQLGRCGVAMACIGTEIMPKDGEERGEISSVTPSGWYQAKYNHVSGKYLYHRSHLIGWQLTAENANERNLITGTEYMNTDGMLPFENMVAKYIKNTKNHVMYRVTPDFKDDNLVASGVLIEAWSVEDNGKGIAICVYVYNRQPGVAINYKTGESKLISDSTAPENPSTPSDIPGAKKYILNTSSMKFHLESCSYAQKTAATNKQYYTGYRDDLIEEGYTPCGNCNP